MLFSVKEYVIYPADFIELCRSRNEAPIKKNGSVLKQKKSFAVIATCDIISEIDNNFYWGIISVEG